MVATKSPRKTPTPAAAKSAGRLKSPVEKAPAEVLVSAEVVAEPVSPPVIDAVEPPKPVTVVEAAPEPGVAEPEAASEPEPVVVAAAEPEPQPEPEPEDAGIAGYEGVEELASLAEQVIYEAEAIAGEAAHNFQVALKAAAEAQTIVPTLSGINSYLHRSVRINAQFMEEFAAVWSPIDLVGLQVRFLEEHRLAMLEFAQGWAARKSAA